jgi:hypothetical protein
MALIVASILIAFALNAWWEAAREDREESRHLAAVRGELAANQLYLRERIDALDQMDAAIAALIARIGPTPDPLPPDSIAALLDTSFGFGTLELAMGSIQALLASGELALLSNEELKRRIAAWPARAADARNDATLLVQNREDIIRHLDTLMPTLAIARNTGVLNHYSTTRFPIEPLRILSDRSLEGLLANRGIRLFNVRLDLQKLVAESDTIITLIDSDGV